MRVMYAMRSDSLSRRIRHIPGGVTDKIIHRHEPLRGANGLSFLVFVSISPRLLSPPHKFDQHDSSD